MGEPDGELTRSGASAGGVSFVSAFWGSLGFGLLHAVDECGFYWWKTNPVSARR